MKNHYKTIRQIYRRGFVVIFLLGLVIFYIDRAGATSLLGGPVRIGLVVDMSGPLSEVGGRNSVEAARMSIEDFGSTVLGRKVEAFAVDDQGKPDVAASLVQSWIGRKEVDALIAGSSSVVAMTIHELGRTNKIPVFFSAPANPALTGSACSPMSIQFVWDSYGTATTIGRELMKRHIDTWFIIAPDNANGQAGVAAFSSAIIGAGGKIVGVVKHPTNIADFSSYVLQAQASGAKGIAPFSTGLDLLHLLKQMSEFNVADSQLISGVSLTVAEIRAVGLGITHDMRLVTPFYQNYDDATRAWTKRFTERTHSRVPSAFQAGAYSAVLHYLKAIRATQTTDGPAVVAKMKSMPINDFEMKNISIRADGQTMRPLLLARVKRPAQSKSELDYLDIERVVPPEQAWRSLAEAGCSFATKK